VSTEGRGKKETYEVGKGKVETRHRDRGGGADKSWHDMKPRPGMKIGRAKVEGGGEVLSSCIFNIDPLPWIRMVT